MTVETKSKLSLEIQKSIKDLLKFQKETNRQINKLAAEAEKDRKQAEKDRKQAEKDRKQAEKDRKKTEKDRKAAEVRAEKDRKAAEARAEKDRKAAEARAEKDRKKTDLQISKLAAETAKAFEKATEAIEKNVKDTEKWRTKARDFVTGEVGNRWGELVEVITKENLGRLLKERGFKIHRVYGNVTDEDKRQWEIDVMAVNGKEIVIVEAKASLTVKDVKLFIKKKLPNIREYLPEHKDKKIHGAVAYLRSKVEASDKKKVKHGKDAAKYAFEQGLFVISVTGETASMLNDKSFKPKAF